MNYTDADFTTAVRAAAHLIRECEPLPLDLMVNLMGHGIDPNDEDALIQTWLALPDNAGEFTSGDWMEHLAEIADDPWAFVHSEAAPEVRGHLLTR